MKTFFKKRPHRQDRQKHILFSLIELFIKTGKPIGSQTLQKEGFKDFSSATIRNYFAKLEKQGFLQQQHISGGRIPTDNAFQFYAKNIQDINPEEIKTFAPDFVNTKEVKALLHKCTEQISEKLGLTCIASFPIFDQDFLQKIKCIQLDKQTIVCILVTDYGQIRTETLYINTPEDKQVLFLTEKYFLWRIGKEKKPEFSHESSFIFARKVYTEIMLRHALMFGNSIKNSLYKTGLCHLMRYPELNNTNDLSASLLFFENEEVLAKILKKTMEEKKLTFWIGKDLFPYIKKYCHFSLIAVPYYINHTPVGAISCFGPLRIDYKNVFRVLKGFSLKLSECLTKNIYKHKIPFRNTLEEERIGSACSILLEDKSRVYKDNKGDIDV